MKIIDNSNLTCPQPVINTKKAIQAGLPLVSIVDNKIAKENVVKLCKNLGLTTNVEEKDNKFEIEIWGSQVIEQSVNKAENQLGETYLITSNLMGKGDEKLGQALMKAFIYTLTQKEQIPAKIMLINSGVFLASEGSQVISQLEELVQKGTQLLACGTCLDFYSLKEKLSVGTVTNMYDIVDGLEQDKVITI